MKTRNLLFAFIATMTLFAGCGKDNNSSNIAENTLFYDGQTYHMIVDVWPQNQYVTLLVADSEETGSNSEAVVRFDGFHIFGWNQTVDLASPGDDEYALSFQWDSGFSIYAYAAPYGIGDDNGGLHYIGGNIGEEKFDGESLFTEGTLSVSGNNDGTPITVILDGKLKNGKTLKMKLVSGNYDICW